MVELNHTCKFCGCEIRTSYDPECPDMKLDIWKGMLACNRCADFESQWRNTCEKASEIGLPLIAMYKQNPEKCAETKAKLLAIFESLFDLIANYLKIGRPSCDPLFEEAVRDPRRIAAILAFHRDRSFKAAGFKKQEPRLGVV